MNVCIAETYTIIFCRTEEKPTKKTEDVDVCVAELIGCTTKWCDRDKLNFWFISDDQAVKITCCSAVGNANEMTLWNPYTCLLVPMLKFTRGEERTAISSFGQTAKPRRQRPQRSLLKCNIDESWSKE